MGQVEDERGASIRPLHAEQEPVTVRSSFQFDFRVSFNSISSSILAILGFIIAISEFFFADSCFSCCDFRVQFCLSSLFYAILVFLAPSGSCGKAHAGRMGGPQWRLGDGKPGGCRHRGRSGTETTSKRTQRELRPSGGGGGGGGEHLIERQTNPIVFLLRFPSSILAILF